MPFIKRIRSWLRVLKIPTTTSVLAIRFQRQKFLEILICRYIKHFYFRSLLPFYFKAELQTFFTFGHSVAHMMRGES